MQGFVILDKNNYIVITDYRHTLGSVYWYYQGALKDILANQTSV